MTEWVVLRVAHDPSLVTPTFLAEHLLELEGVETVDRELG